MSLAAALLDGFRLAESGTAKALCATLITKPYDYPNSYGFIYCSVKPANFSLLSQKRNSQFPRAPTAVVSVVCASNPIQMEPSMALDQHIY